MYSVNRQVNFKKLFFVEIVLQMLFVTYLKLTHESKRVILNYFD